MNDRLETSRPLAPEDIKEGNYVAVLGVLLELVRWECEPAIPNQPPEIGRVLCLPWKDASPLRVVSVCLPFILVEDARGKHQVLDARQLRLGRVTERFGKKAFKRLTRVAPTRVE